jgi:predicted DNA-binding transcriptional regulator AlpA
MGNTSASDDVLMSVDEAAEYTGLDKQTFYKWNYLTKRGQPKGPPVHRAGNLLRYRKSEIDTWLAREQESAR